MTSAPSARPSSPKLLWPFLLLTSFLVSVLLLQTRLIGELVDGPALLFGDKSAGGSGALISITYLVPLLGAVFGWILTGQRDAPDRPGLAAGLHVLALGTVIVGFGLVIAVLEVQYPTFLYLLAPVSAFSLFLCWRAWAGLFRKLFLYGLTIRLVVVGLTVWTVQAGMGTHFDALPTDADGIELPTTQRMVQLSAAQILLWIPFTTAVGGLFGSIASMIRGRRKDDRPDH